MGKKMSKNKVQEEKIRAILPILVCPSCKSPLKAKKKDEKIEFLHCEQCSLNYETIDEIPNLMIHTI